LAAGFHELETRIALGIIDELVMGQVLQAVVVRNAQNRKHAQPVGGQLVEQPIAKKEVMAGFVAQGDQPVLTDADHEDGHSGDWKEPSPVNAPINPVLIKGDGDSCSANEEQVFTAEIEPVGPIIRAAQRVDTAL